MCIRDRPESNYLWWEEDAPWSTERLSQELRKVTQHHLHLKDGLGVAGYRNAAIAMSREFLRPRLDYDPEDGIGAWFAQQAGHSARMEDNVYGLTGEMVRGVADAALAH